MTNAPSERSIFLTAVEKTNLADQLAYLDQACGDDAELRQSVDALLKSHERPAKLLDRGISPVLGDPLVSPTPPDSGEQHVGKSIGDYRLMEQIGEGGFGLVFVAQQDQPVRRKVAFKIVKPGTGSKEVIARFEAERQAVALMDHPNIAQVFDAGVTEDGRPYFVMELVRGIPITEFCDNHQLDVEERLQLFNDVCHAVHHAHQKGVIHRDIKPSNVMVTLLDGRPIAKVIDFGVAKAIGQSLTDKTIYTRFFSMIGTPLYMSPEQAEMSGVDVDTRSDIYSLGVLLYELLVGATPFDRERLDSAGYDELRRILREEEPLWPSRRLTTLMGEAGTTIATRRMTSPLRLSGAVRGDLDWIVMKALDKDRGRRYESAAALAEDVRRHLRQRPIEARPPSGFYLLSKFAKRNRVAIVTMTLIAASLLAGTAASLWQMKVAMKERDEKELALREIEQFAEKITTANSLIASARLHADAGRREDAIADLNAAVNQQPSYYLPWVARGHYYTQLGLWNDAADDYASALELESPVDTQQWWGTAALFQLTQHEQAHQRLIATMERYLAEDQPIRDWEWVRMAVAGNKGLSNESLETLKRLAQQWLSEQDRPGRPRFGPPPNLKLPSQPRRPPAGRPGRPSKVRQLPRPVCEYILGMLHLRLGEYDQAIRTLERVGRDPNWPTTGLVHAPLAISYAKTQDQPKAARALQQSRDALQRLSDSTDDPRSTEPDLPWFDLVEMRVLYQEASHEVASLSTPE